MRRQPFLHWIRQAGVLTWATAAFGFVAFIVHLTSRSLPSAYDWVKPVHLLWSVIGRRHFASMALGVYALGMLAGVGWTGVVAQMREARGSMRLHALVAAAVMAGLTLGIWPDASLLDRLAWALLAFRLAHQPPSAKTLVRYMAQLAYVAVIFTVVSYAFTVFKALLFVGVEPKDHLIVTVEEMLTGTKPHQVVAAWAAQHPAFVSLSDRIYYRLFDHMALASVFLMGLRKNDERNELLSSLSFAYLIGAVAYHLLPGLGPAFYDAASYQFLREGPPLLSNHFHARLLANTMAVAEGRATLLDPYEFLACVPSLHMAHEFVMLYYARHSRWFFALSFVFTALTSAAVVVLGWHYPIDVLTGLVLAIVSIALARRWRPMLFPAAFSEPIPSVIQSRPGRTNVGASSAA